MRSWLRLAGALAIPIAFTVTAVAEPGALVRPEARARLEHLLLHASTWRASSSLLGLEICDS